MLRFSISIILMGLFSANAFPQVFQKHPATKGLYGYYLYLPKSYETSPNDLFPLLIAFHGVGEGGSGSDTDLNKLTSTGIPKIIANGSWPANRPFIVVCPQSSKGFFNPEIIKSTIDHITRTYRADVNRIYMTGFSAGAISIWNDLNDHYMSYVAAVIPVSGARNRDYDICNVKHVPIWAFHGEADPNGPTPPGATLKNVQAVNACIPAPNPKAKATIYPGVGHNAWDITYNLKGMTSTTTYDPYDVDIYTWLLQHSLKKSSFAITSFVSSATSVVNDQTTSIRFTANITGEASSVTVNLTSLGGTANHTLIKNGSLYYIDYQVPTNLSTGSKTIILTAIDGNGQSLTKSLNILVQENNYIEPPGNLNSIPKGTGRIQLEWNDNSHNEEGFIIEYKEASQAFFNVLQTVRENILGYTAANLKCNTTYEFRVKAVNDVGESAYSNTSSCATESLAPPNISSSGNTSFCMGESVKISANTDYSEYLWNNNANTKDLVVTESGTYRLKVKDAEGCWSAFSNAVAVTVHPIPSKPVINEENTQGLCPGSVSKLTAPAGYDQYLWSTGETSQRIEVSKEGDYTVLVAKNQCWSAVSDPANIAFKSKPATPVLHYNSKTELCIGETVNLKAPEGFAYYQWSNGINTSAITIDQTGTYSVQVANCPGRWSDPSEIINLKFNPVPPKPLINFDHKPYCKGETAILSIEGEFQEYKWSNNATAADIKVTTDGRYSAKVKNEFNCWSNSSDLVEVSFKTPAAKPIIESASEIHLCEGETTLLSTVGKYEKFFWSNGEITPTIEVKHAGTYSVKTSNCVELWSESSESVNVIIHEPAIPEVSVSDNTLFTNEYPSYQWFKNGIPIAGAVNQHFVPDNESLYSVKIIDLNGCSATSEPKKFRPESFMFKVYPNPTTGMFFLELYSHQPSYATVAIKNLQGNTLYFNSGFKLSLNNGTPLEINISGFDKGLYFLYIYNGEKLIKEKIILQ